LELVEQQTTSRTSKFTRRISWGAARLLLLDSSKAENHHPEIFRQHDGRNIRKEIWYLFGEPQPNIGIPVTVDIQSTRLALLKSVNMPKREDIASDWGGLDPALMKVMLVPIMASKSSCFSIYIHLANTIALFLIW
jgi:hypothetical protein